jgi:hypothetical protein
MYVVTLEDYTPTARYDGGKWVGAIIEEAASETGPWTQLETQELVPLDTDPENPLTRNFTTELATIPVGGWYKVTFTDATGDFLLPTNPVQNAPSEIAEFYPTVTEVASKILGRTCDDLAQRQGTFTDVTTPTAKECQEVIEDAAIQVGMVLGNEIPDVLLDSARDLTALRAAMLIELEFYGSEVANGRSAYPQLKALYDELWPQVLANVQWVEAGGDAGDPGEVAGEDGDGGAGLAFFNFPPVDPLLTKRM